MASRRYIAGTTCYSYAKQDLGPTPKYYADKAAGTADQDLDFFQRRVQPHLEYWVPLLQLDHWNIDYVVEEIIAGDPSLLATCEVFPQCGDSARITFSRLLDNRTDEDVEDAVIEELTHLIFDAPARFALRSIPRGNDQDWYIDLFENSITNLVKALRKHQRKEVTQPNEIVFEQEQP